MKFTQEQCSDLLEEEGAKRIEVDPSYRHGTYNTYVVPFEGKMYMFTLSVHHSEGWDDCQFPVDAVEAVPVTTTITDWVPA